jgi:thiamine biosynthesis protein ThiI
MACDVALMRYHEIVLKGRNRPYFVRRLAEHVARLVVDLPVGAVDRASSRLLLPVHDVACWPELCARLGRVFGLANFALAIEVPLGPRGGDPTAAVARLGEVALARLGGRRPASFRVVTKRSDKLFPMPSPEVSRLVGSVVKEATGARVDLEDAELTVAIDIVPERAFVSLEKHAGAGGLPVSTSGRVLALLSGGIDSPVAAWRMMRRGCRVDFVHFHSMPFHDRTSQEKARELARILVRWQLDAVLHVVPFGEVQRQIVAAVRRPIRVVLYRRMMLRIAEEIARRRQAEALVTGESLGQVASQTLGNLAIIEAAAGLPVLRPLIGMDKGEISDAAAALGTLETSIIPDQDCCQLFVPRHPTTRASGAAVLRAERTFDVAALVALAVGGTESIRLHFPATTAAEEAIARGISC